MNYPRYKYIFAFFDFSVVFMSFVLSAYITKNVLNKNVITYENNVLTFITFLIFSVIFILLFQNNYLYKVNVFLTRAPHITAILKSFIYGTLLLILFSFVIKFNLLLSSRVFVLCFFFTGMAGVALVRLFLLKPFYMNFTKILNNSVVLIVGAGKSGRLLAEKLIFENFYGIKIAGFLDDNIEKEDIVFKNIKCVGKINEIAESVKKYKADEIIIAIDNIGYENLMKIIDRCTKLEKSVKLTSELFNIVPEKIKTDTYSGIPVVDLSPKVNRNINYFYKRIFDYSAAFAGIVILSPVFLIISILVKLSSRGEIFFTQIRIGKDGKPFKFYKFRSMLVDNDEAKTREIKMKDFIKNDKKQHEGSSKIINVNNITPIGKILRKTSLDELPQLFNVLKGDMSLVGPRPCLPYEYETFDEWHKRRHSVLPGCTGVWQVSGRSSVSFKDSVVLDLYYINNMTPWLDLQLILKTFPVMLFGRGAK
ncbi:MAG TPA: sugar transferase [Ignavibacteria bacterium]|nr:sugar transferase [Ignavibacteria bacterium]HMR39837.1 sugar transferase [Ignavibacteria bacterium]